MDGFDAVEGMLPDLVEVFGAQAEKIFVEISQKRLAALGLDVATPVDLEPDFLPASRLAPLDAVAPPPPSLPPPRGAGTRCVAS